jgi:cyanophycinase
MSRDGRRRATAMTPEPDAAVRVRASSSRPPLADTARGTLVLMGGAVEPRGRALGAFLELAHARDGGRIVVLTTASATPVEAARAWAADFRAAGARNVQIPRFRRGDHAVDHEIADAIADADAVFLGGGDQVTLVAALGGSATLAAIRRAFLRGATIGGTSAGAAALTELTMAGGEIDEEGNLVEQYLGPGLGLLGHDAIIDTHFSQRRRLQRLFLVVAENPRLFGLGIDEDTALVVNGCVGRVVGAGGVTFVDGRESVRFDNAEGIERGRQLTVSSLRVGIVGTDYGLDLVDRELEVLVPKR